MILPATFKWVCKYCDQPQETGNFQIEGERPYSEIIQEAAKAGTTCCMDCFHYFMSRVKRF